jgi:hypothetical protein
LSSLRDVLVVRNDFVYMNWKDPKDDTLLLYSRTSNSQFRSDSVNAEDLQDEAKFFLSVIINLNNQNRSTRKKQAMNRLNQSMTHSIVGDMLPIEELSELETKTVYPRDYILKAKFL